MTLRNDKWIHLPYSDEQVHDTPKWHITPGSMVRFDGSQVKVSNNRGKDVLQTNLQVKI